jgi:hypothetical protein
VAVDRRSQVEALLFERLPLLSAAALASAHKRLQMSPIDADIVENEVTTNEMAV